MEDGEVTEEKLRELITQKHERLLSEYRQELDTMKRIDVVKEKLDQINHWLKESHKKRPRELSDRKREAQEELANLKGRLPGGRRQGRSQELAAKIKAQEEALAYWRKKK